MCHTRLKPMVPGIQSLVFVQFRYSIKSNCFHYVILCFLSIKRLCAFRKSMLPAVEIKAVPAERWAKCCWYFCWLPELFSKAHRGSLEQSFSQTNTHSEHCFADLAIFCEVRGGILINLYMPTHACTNSQRQISDYMCYSLVLCSLYGRTFCFCL